jgi:type II secretory pathway pseudopilin PulG
MHKKFTSQIGRTMLEMLVVVVLMALIFIGVYETYRFVVDKATSQTINQELNARLIQMRHQALTGKGIQNETADQALKRALSNKSGSGLPIQVQTGEGEFTVLIGTSDYPLELPICQDILNDYEANKHQCFVSGECDGENGVGKFKFSNHCSLS